MKDSEVRIPALIFLALTALACVLLFTSTSSARPPAPTAPDIAAVLASGNDADYRGIRNLSEVTLDSIHATAPWNHATQLSLDQDVEAQATNGDPGYRGGDVSLKAGYGDDGTTAGADIQVQGGRADGPGYVVIVTGDSQGEVGDCLRNLGGGRAAWEPCP